MTTQPHAVDPATIPDGTLVLVREEGRTFPVFKDRDGWVGTAEVVGLRSAGAWPWHEGRIVAVLHRDGECPAPPEPEWITDPEEARRVVVLGAGIVSECSEESSGLRVTIRREGVVGQVDRHGFVTTDGREWRGEFRPGFRWRVLTPAPDPDAEERAEVIRRLDTRTGFDGEALLSMLDKHGLTIVRRDEEGQS